MKQALIVILSFCILIIMWVLYFIGEPKPLSYQTWVRIFITVGVMAVAMKLLIKEEATRV